MSQAQIPIDCVAVPRCPISGEEGEVRFAAAVDAFFDTPGRWRYRANTRTGHLWLDPRPAPHHIGEIYKNYYTHSATVPATTTTLWERALALALARRLGYPQPGDAGAIAHVVSYLPTVADAAAMEVLQVPAARQGTLLDVGCGGGAFLSRMRDAGWKVTGTEPDPRAAARLREELGFPVFVQVEDIDATHQRFDLITLNHVIEHVPDPAELLRQLTQRLARGGQIIVTTPNAASLGARIFGRHWRGLEPPRHFNVFSQQSLAETVEQAGLVVRTMRTEARLARTIFYLSVLARRGGRNLEAGGMLGGRLLKLAGYGFQLLEGIARSLSGNAGEEIYCVVSPRS